MLKDMLFWEEDFYNKGVDLIAGIDEVGKGPLAGPLVVSAVILDLEKVFSLRGVTNTNEKPANSSNQNNTILHYNKINDSKKVTDRNRRILSDFIRNEAISYSIIEISHTEIDKLGISNATQKAFFQSIVRLDKKPSHVLTDFLHIKKLTRRSQTNIPKGDSVSLTIAAASIVAKVYRDDIMINMHETYPEYEFHKHKGYGTKRHIEAIKTHGPCEIHRKSFEPIKTYLKNFNHS